MNVLARLNLVSVPTRRPRVEQALPLERAGDAAAQELDDLLRRYVRAD